MKEKEQVIKNITICDQDKFFIVMAELSDGSILRLLKIFKDGSGFEKYKNLPDGKGLNVCSNGAFVDKKN
jgi:hypothetical protein